MKAVVLEGFGGVENFSLQEVQDPTIKDNEILVKVKACSFNPADYQIRKGGPEANAVDSMILGRDLSGIVVKVGEAVNDFKAGDEVMAYSSIMGSNGSNAEYIALPANIVGKKPANLSFEQSAAIPVVGLTALQTIYQCALKPSQSIFLTGGSGGVGTFFIQLARHYGIKNIITTYGSRESYDHLLKIGIKPEQMVNYRQDSLAEEILKKNEGELYDVCIDYVGGRISETAAEVLKIGGTFADITFLGTQTSRTTIFNKSATLQNIAIYANALSNDEDLRARFGRDLDLLSELFQNGSLEPTPIVEVGNFSVEAVQKGHTLLENNAAKGKLVMSFP